MGSICYSVMVSLGEMIAYFPVPGGHIKLAEMFVNQSFSFTMGWNAWYAGSVFKNPHLSSRFSTHASLTVVVQHNRTSRGTECLRSANQLLDRGRRK